MLYPPPQRASRADIKVPRRRGMLVGGAEHRVNKIMQAGPYFCFTTAVLSHRIKLSTRSDTMYFIPAIQYNTANTQTTKYVPVPFTSTEIDCFKWLIRIICLQVSPTMLYLT